MFWVWISLAFIIGALISAIITILICRAMIVASTAVGITGVSQSLMFSPRSPIGRGVRLKPERLSVRIRPWGPKR
jgi:hypothetical protein